MDLDKSDETVADVYRLQKTQEENCVFDKESVISENAHPCDLQHAKVDVAQMCEEEACKPSGVKNGVLLLDEIKLAGSHFLDRACSLKTSESDAQNMKGRQHLCGEAESEVLTDQERLAVPKHVVGMHKTPIFTMKRMKDGVSPGSQGHGTCSKNDNFRIDSLGNLNCVEELSPPVAQNSKTDNTELIVKYKRSAQGASLEFQSSSQAVFPVPYTSLYERTSDRNLQTPYSQCEPVCGSTRGGTQGSFSHCCEFCGKAYASHHQLKRHTKNHTMEKVHKCDQCNTAFMRACDLVRHKRIHSGVKEVKCPDCAAQFAQASDLNRHRMVHTGERPFKCEFCGAAFSRLGNLNQHRRTHTGEKPYKCEECGAAFSQGGLLTSHKRKHTGDMKHICFECGAAFTQGGDLTKHKRIHSGERPFRCEECGKGFMQSGHLMQHRRTHTGEKPFICKVCGEAYKQASHLAKHSIKHSKEYTQKKKRNN